MDKKVWNTIVHKLEVDRPDIEKPLCEMDGDARMKMTEPTYKTYGSQKKADTRCEMGSVCSVNTSQIELDSRTRNTGQARCSETPINTDDMDLHMRRAHV